MKPAHNENQNAGYIYVMSSPALERDIFKIGRTNADPRRRAEDLSKATGVPVQYLVVEDWWVADCVRVEALIHEVLKEYRLTDSREFFRAPYKVIRNAIEHVIDGLSA
ncbi:MAG TPA: GIY-YIG nuclease family protein [Bryobacteraceae bacterium]|nr:GIY-YIG nuclease family protein [Bryobacteraceae bacterium]